MTEPNHDRPGDDQLRALFTELREEVVRSTPSFGSVLERAAAEAREQPALGVIRGAGTASRRRVLEVGAWASAAIAATVAGLLLFDSDRISPPSEDDQFAELVAAYSQDMSAGAWRSPTSSLLDVPGMELVRGVPSLGLPAVGLDGSGGAATIR